MAYRLAKFLSSFCHVAGRGSLQSTICLFPPKGMMLAKSGACSFCVLGFVMVSGWFAKTPGESMA